MRNYSSGIVVSLEITVSTAVVLSGATVLLFYTKKSHLGVSHVFFIKFGLAGIIYVCQYFCRQ